MVIGLLDSWTPARKPMPMTWTSPPNMKMTTKIPTGITIPDKLETRLGTLALIDGVPDAATAQKIYDNPDFQALCKPI